MLRALAIRCESVAEIDPFESENLVQRIRRWAVDEGPWWGCSFTIHLLLLCMLAALGSRAMPESVDREDVLAAAEREDEPEVPQLANMMSDPDVELVPPKTPDFDVRPPTDAILSDADKSTAASSPLDVGGLGGDGRSAGDADPAPLTRDGLIGIGSGSGRPGILGGSSTSDCTLLGFSAGGTGNNPFANRGRRGICVDDTRRSIQRVAGALGWLARHQNLPEGNWSFQKYVACCHDATCTGPGSADADSAATAMGLLPFLASGQTHLSKGPYRKTVASGIAWLVRNQKPDGDLRCGSTMYAHGLATITLCEIYGMTGDRAIGYAAQRAVDFIQAAQNRTTGGWRYKPGDEGDLSVLGWQVMALKSAQMAGLQVDPAVLQRAGTFVRATTSGSQGTSQGGLFSYVAGGPPSTTMTSVGLLCSQYMGAARDDPSMVEGTAHLLHNLPDPAARDLYYWYYATQVMHNQPGSDWDTWNRKMRKILVETQNREGCAAGSWDPQHPAPDRWGSHGGRLMMTSLAALTLEVYYRYLPLYQLDGKKVADVKR